MKFTYLLIAAVLIIAVSCKKNSYTTKPQITITSINTLIDSGGNLTVTFKFTDKQGDLGGGSFNFPAYASQPEYHGQRYNAGYDLEPHSSFS